MTTKLRTMKLSPRRPPALSLRPNRARTRWILALLAVLLVASPALGKRKSKQGEINGRVLNQSGETLSGVTVQVTGADFDEATTSNNKGEFKIEIPGATGSYQVHLALEGYTPFEATIDLEVGDEQNIDFRLIDEATGRRQQAVEAYNAGVRAFNAGEKDDILMPWHAYKYAAQMQASQTGTAPIFLRVDWGGGHYPASAELSIQEWADRLVFLARALEMAPRAGE